MQRRPRPERRINFNAQKNLYCFSLYNVILHFGRIPRFIKFLLLKLYKYIIHALPGVGVKCYIGGYKKEVLLKFQFEFTSNFN